MTVLPGAAIGVLGSGQLGRMFAIAARRMGYRVHTLSPDEDTPTGQIADIEINAPYDDLDAIRSFASQVDVVTFEFENVPAATAAAAGQMAPVRPSGEILHITQHRLREKTWLQSQGFPVTQFVGTAGSLAAGALDFPFPAILKTAGFGYDGKGQTKISSRSALPPITQESVLEAVVDYEYELSVVAARTEDGNIVHYAPSINHHTEGILDVSIAPLHNPEAIAITHAVLDQLKVVGVLCVEFFLTKSGKLLINELAPRPHNSGHLTIDSCVTSQFEQQLRAVCGLPLGSPSMFRPAAMANLLGDLWHPAEPNWSAACANPDAKLHLYGKLDPRPGRKMGHITATAETPEAAEALVRKARADLTSSTGSDPGRTPRNTGLRSPHTSDAYTPNPK